MSFICCFTFSVFGQLAQLILTANTSNSYYFVVNDALTDSLPKTELRIIANSAKNLDVQVYSDSLQVFGSTTFSLRPGYVVNYDILEFGDRIQVLEASAVTQKDSIKNAILLSSLDSLQLPLSADSLRNLYLTKKYGNKAGCLPPLSSREFEDFKSRVTSKIFSSKQIQVLKEELPNTCLQVDQINALFLLFDFDEPKIEIAKTLGGNIFNLEDLEDLNPELILESNEKSFNQIIKSLNQD